MAVASINLLIGAGETLSGRMKRPPQPRGEKTFHYSIEEQREYLGPRLAILRKEIEATPAEAMALGEATSLVTVHPAFLAKTQFPGDVFDEAGLRAVGSRYVRRSPRKDIRRRASRGVQETADIYISGRADAYRKLQEMLHASGLPTALLLELRKIEDVAILTAGDRALHLEGEDSYPYLEVVLHADGAHRELFEHFAGFVDLCGGHADLDRRYVVSGLTFVPTHIPRPALQQFCQYTAIRAVRPMPKLRVSRPPFRQSQSHSKMILPHEEALRPDLRVAVFDGGIGISALDRWCVETVPVATASTDQVCLDHGAEVTSTLLFGPLQPNATELDRPYFGIDHHRVVGPGDNDFDLYDCMHRIDQVLSEHRYSFANLSLGPTIPIEDSHPHAWTCMLDRYLAQGELLATVAVGNDGEMDGRMGRIQPPSDAVNALAVGSADSTGFLWKRVAHSCYGPGRSPGRVKPDGLAFGGTDVDPLLIFSPHTGGVTHAYGTSYAAAAVMRLAASVRAVCDTPFSATLLRALLIHRAERSEHAIEEVGWGRFPATLDALLTCPDNEATILYQGALLPGQPQRAQVPMPNLDIGTNVTLTATFCFACPVDAAHPINYTRRGLTVVFRPGGPKSSSTFFSAGGGESEQELRQDALKWETVLHRSHSFPAWMLSDPLFDVQLGIRKQGRSTKSRMDPMPYVLIVTVASDRKEPVYNDILRRYRTLKPIRLRHRIQLRN